MRYPTDPGVFQLRAKGDSYCGLDGKPDVSCGPKAIQTHTVGPGVIQTIKLWTQYMLLFVCVIREEYRYVGIPTQWLRAWDIPSRWMIGPIVCCLLLYVYCCMYGYFGGNSLSFRAYSFSLLF